MKPRKRFGQNFLRDRNIICKIIEFIGPISTDHIVEIGPGLGALTKYLLPLLNTLEAIEIDRDLIPELTTLAQPLGQLSLYSQDVLMVDFTKLIWKDEPLRIVGNLPYNISTPLLFHLFAQKDVIQDMHFMLQKEVADRLRAKPGTKEYGRLSIMAQYHCHIIHLLNVPPTAFYPPPKVHSSFVRLIPITPPLLAQNPLKFSEVVKAAFNQRRKILKNCLENWVTEQQLNMLGIDPHLRPEQLSVEDFVRISNL